MFLNIGRYFELTHGISVFILGIFELPFDLSVEIPNGIDAVRIAFCAHYQLACPVGTAVNLPAIAVRAYAVAVVKIDVEKVVLVAGEAAVTTPVSYGTDRCFAHEPIHHVDVVNMGIEDMVAAEPAKVVPVSYHVGHVVPAFFAHAEPDMLLVPECLGGGEPSDGPCLHALVSFDLIFLVAALGTGDNTETKCLGLFRGSND